MTVTWRILQGDVCERLASLPAASVQTCVTSPPYWGLRDYGTATWDGGDPACDHALTNARQPTDRRSSTLGGGVATIAAQDAGVRARATCGKCGAKRIDAQIGLEPTPSEYVTRMVEVFAEVHRVLREDGTLWLNLGDSYANTGAADSSKVGGFTGARIRAGAKGIMDSRPRKIPEGIKQKDLVGIPWMVAFALRDYGWYLRSEIIWHKPNPMPESVTDRPTKSHEQIFLFSKSARYYYDAEAIMEEAVSTGAPRRDPGGTDGYVDFGMSRGRAGNRGDGTRNKRSVWTVATQPYPEAHFATYPEALIEPCILAGTSERGQCPACGAPWERVVEREAKPSGRSGDDVYTGQAYATPQSAVWGSKRNLGGDPRPTETIGWQPSCECHAGDPVPQLVLDPFTGSGTTGAVAIRHQRSFVGTELNPAYIDLARRRIGDVAPLLASEVA